MICINKRWWRDIGGSIAPIFALSLIVLVGSVGLSIDGARVYHAQLKIQAVGDAAVLAAGRRAIVEGDTNEAEATIAQFVQLSGIHNELTLRPVTTDLSAPRRIAAEFIADVPTFIMTVLGFTTVEVRAYSAAEFGITKLEVALALDTTGSMAGPKMTALKSSAERMVNTLLDTAHNPDDVRISLVPFGQYVNVGTDQRNASWLQVPNDYSTTNEWCRDEAPVISSTNCRTVTYTYYQDGTPMTGSYTQCDNTYGPAVYTCTPYTSTYTWYGCVGARNYPLNVRDADYGNRIPGIMNVGCGGRVQPLTSQRSDLRNAIDAMSATGETYIPAGVMWGLRTLTPSEPYSESAGDARDNEGNRIAKVLVLMTDGENTKSPTYPGHDGSDAAMSNQLTLEACNEAKSKRLQIFTIAFSVTSDPVKNLLRSCASRTGNFFDAADAEQLDAAMQAIAGQLGSLRLTQ